MRVSRCCTGNLLRSYKRGRVRALSEDQLPWSSKLQRYTQPAPALRPALHHNTGGGSFHSRRHLAYMASGRLPVPPDAPEKRHWVRLGVFWSAAGLGGLLLWNPSFFRDLDVDDEDDVSAYCHLNAICGIVKLKVYSSFPLFQDEKESFDLDEDDE
ncbi:unnamed protein product [Chrysoparadoxa australica]